MADGVNGNGHGDGETKALDAIDLATAKEDKICIQRDHATGQLSWRTATPQADALGLMFRVLWYSMAHESQLWERVEALEAKIKGLEARLEG